MAQRPRKPNHRLAALIAEAGLSNKGLARRVVRLGEARGHPGLEYNHSSVDRWLRGERPRAHAVWLLAEKGDQFIRALQAKAAASSAEKLAAAAASRI